MKIAFLGDSITEGIPGVNYVNILKSLLPNDQLDNYGLGGDTVSSLYNRIKDTDFKDYDIIVLFIGINDIYSSLTKNYEKLKIKTGQLWAKSTEEFSNSYDELLQLITKEGQKIIVIPPLVIGEMENNIWNQKVSKLVLEIEHHIKKYRQIHYIDVRKMFFNVLQDLHVSNYLPKSILRLLLDVKLLNTVHKIDKKSQKRGLHLTLDGVHLNSLGASMLSNAIYNKIEVI